MVSSPVRQSRIRSVIHPNFHAATPYHFSSNTFRQYGGLSTGTLRVRRRGFDSMTPCVGNVVLRRKPQSTFCVSVRSWPHSGIHIWVPSLWTQTTLGYQVWGPSGTLLKEQGSYNLVQNMGPQRACFKAYVHRAQKGSHPNAFLFYSICLIKQAKLTY